MLPRTALEIAAWVAFALSAGLCEEVVYRGYLFSQCLAGTRSSLAAVVIQAAVYALAHLALPMEMIIPIFLLGLLLGGLAMWQKSLLPGMMLHGGVGLLAVLGSARA
jgi:membrane protease YdiL (CAAX protease family)